MLPVLPESYATTFAELKARIESERLRVVLAANSAMVLLYWDIGRVILARQENEGWGAKVVDRLSADLSRAFPDMRGLSPRNLRYMRAFAAAWPDRGIVQEVLAGLTWYHNLALMEKLSAAEDRLWYARKACVEGWSRNILALQISRRLHEREGRAQNNFPATLPPPDSDMAAQVFKDPYLFDFLGTADLGRRQPTASPCRRPDHRAPPVPWQGPGRGGVRPPRAQAARRRGGLGDPARSSAPRGSPGEPSVGGGAGE